MYRYLVKLNGERVAAELALSLSVIIIIISGIFKVVQIEDAPFEFRRQIYRAKSWGISLLSSENRVILALSVPSQYTRVTDRRQTDKISWQ